MSDSDGGDPDGETGGRGSTVLGSTHFADSGVAYTAPASYEGTGDFGTIINPKASVGFVSFVGSFTAVSSGTGAA